MGGSESVEKGGGAPQTANGSEGEEEEEEHPRHESRRRDDIEMSGRGSVEMTFTANPLHNAIPAGAGHDASTVATTVAVKAQLEP